MKITRGEKKRGRNLLRNYSCGHRCNMACEGVKEGRHQHLLSSLKGKKKRKNSNLITPDPSTERGPVVHRFIKGKKEKGGERKRRKVMQGKKKKRGRHSIRF